MSELEWVDVESLKRRKAQLQRQAARIREELQTILRIERLMGSGAPEEGHPGETYHTEREPKRGRGRPPRRLGAVVEVLEEAGTWLSAEEIHVSLGLKEPEWRGWKVPEVSMRGLFVRDAKRDKLLRRSEDGRYGLAEWEEHEAETSEAPSDGAEV